MRYRALNSDGDMTFGAGQANFLRDSPEAVAQAIKTRFGLLLGEWFLDSTEGTPYLTEILGTGTGTLYDMAIRQRILTTQGVAEVTAYSSSVLDRNLRVNAIVSTIYGRDLLVTVSGNAVSISVL